MISGEVSGEVGGEGVQISINCCKAWCGNSGIAGVFFNECIYVLDLITLIIRPYLNLF